MLVKFGSCFLVSFGHIPICTKLSLTSGEDSVSVLVSPGLWTTVRSRNSMHVSFSMCRITVLMLSISSVAETGGNNEVLKVDAAMGSVSLFRFCNDSNISEFLFNRKSA